MYGGATLRSGASLVKVATGREPLRVPRSRFPYERHREERRMVGDVAMPIGLYEARRPRRTRRDRLESEGATPRATVPARRSALILARARSSAFLARIAAIRSAIGTSSFACGLTL